MTMNETFQTLRPVQRSAFALILNRRGQLLIGYDSGDRVAVPGGKFEDVDCNNPYLALKREIRQEVGSRFRYRLLGACPQIFCTGAEELHTLIDDPLPMDKFDLRFFFFLQALNEKVEEKEPGEFSSPQFVDLAYLEGKIPGIHMRYAVSHALKLYRKELRTELPRETPEVGYTEIRQELLNIGFSGKFAKKHSRPHKAARIAQRRYKQLPHTEAAN